MANGNWELVLHGTGKVFPVGDNDSINTLFLAFIQAIKAEGHEIGIKELTIRQG